MRFADEFCIKSSLSRGRHQEKRLRFCIRYFSKWKEINARMTFLQVRTSLHVEIWQFLSILFYFLDQIVNCALFPPGPCLHLPQGTLRVLGKQNSLFPLGLITKCLVTLESPLLASNTEHQVFWEHDWLGIQKLHYLVLCLVPVAKYDG